MSNQKDLDDQLYILLASMKEYKEAIADDNKRLERFYNQVGSGLLDKAEKSLQSTNRQVLNAFKKPIQELSEATSRLSYHFMALYAIAFVALVCVLFSAMFLFIPSMDEISQRRAEVNQLKQYNLDLSKCDGKTCVRVIKKQCGYGKSGDYCVIDPK